MRPVRPLIGAGPTAVQVVCDSGLDGSIGKMRKLPLTRSATGSPRPEVGSGFWKLSDQLLSVPVSAVLELETTRVQAPPDVSPLNAVSSDCWGLNVPKNGALACWIGVVALS